MQSTPVLRSNHQDADEARLEVAASDEIDPLMDFSRNNENIQECSTRRFAFYTSSCSTRAQPSPSEMMLPTDMRTSWRVNRRYARRLVLVLLICGSLAAFSEWHAQRELKHLRHKLLKFLRETTFEVVKHGCPSTSWQSPLQRKLRALGNFTYRPDHPSRGVLFTSPGVGPVPEVEPIQRSLAGDRRSCPLILTADAQTAKSHGLLLFQEELELLGTVAARVCRCICKAPPANTDKDMEENASPTVPQPPRSNRSTQQAPEAAWPERERRPLRVCDGGETSTVLEEMLKGAHFIVAGDSGWFYRWFTSMHDAHRRTCSHYSTFPTVGVPQGSVLRATLTGTDMYGDSWFQLESAGWRPFRHPVESVHHIFNYIKYKLRHSQVGPLGMSVHTDRRPLMSTYDGCIEEEGNDESGLFSGPGNRLLTVPSE